MTAKLTTCQQHYETQRALDPCINWEDLDLYVRRHYIQRLLRDLEPREHFCDYQYLSWAVKYHLRRLNGFSVCPVHLMN